MTPSVSPEPAACRQPFPAGERTPLLPQGGRETPAPAGHLTARSRLAGLGLSVLSLLWASSLAAQDTGALRTATVALREVDQTYVAEGVVEAVRQSTVSAQISGRVVEVNFDVGDRVEKGQVLLRIDAREVTQALAGSQAQVEQAQAVLARAKAEYERTRLLISQKFVSEAALDKAAAEYKAAQAQLANTLAGAGQAATTKGFATIVAPYAGVVSARHVELGEMAVPGKPLMTGFDPASLRVVASIPQYKLSSIGAGASASVEIPAFKQWVKAQSVTVLPISDPHTLTTRARLDLPAMPAGVFPGMFARAHFIVGRAMKLVVPAEAILRRSEVTAVYVVNAKGTPALRQVRLGEAAGQDGIEVLAGLKPGERVALEPIKAGMLLRQQPG